MNNINIIKQDLAMDEAMKLQGLKQMNDMCEWLEMESSVSFDWYKWVDGYEECPVEDYHQLEGDHKALFVQMINACPDFDACLQAWKGYSILFKHNHNLLIDSVESNGNVFLRGFCLVNATPTAPNVRPPSYNIKSTVTVCLQTKHARVTNNTTIDQLIDQDLDGMAVWIDGVIDFMWGYPSLGPNGYMPATEIPA